MKKIIALIIAVAAFNIAAVNATGTYQTNTSKGNRISLYSQSDSNRSSLSSCPTQKAACSDKMQSCPKSAKSCCSKSPQKCCAGKKGCSAKKNCAAKKKNCSVKSDCSTKQCPSSSDKKSCKKSSGY